MIDPRSIIDPSATIADDVQIGPWTTVGADVEIGAGCVIASHVVIKGPTTIGANNKIFQFSSVGENTADPQCQGESTRLVIADENVIREGVTIHRGTVQGRGETVIGSNNVLMAYVHIGHDSVVGDHCIMENNASLAGHVQVGDWAIISGYTLIHQFCQVGAHSFCGHGSHISKDVPAYVTVNGSPAEARAINIEGLKHRGFSSESINVLCRAYTIVYREGLTTDEALQKLRELNQECSDVDLLIESIEASSRAIAR